MLDPAEWQDLDAVNRRVTGCLPELFGIEFTAIGVGLAAARLEIRPQFLAPNGYLHAATVIALADTACGFGAVASLPAGASGFTTIELKSNFLATAREGVLVCRADARHLGRNTQLWDAEVRSMQGERPLAHFRCTQMVLWPKA
jgi:uncharacterized protein (TIGR00369 family)